MEAIQKKSGNMWIFVPLVPGAIFAQAGNRTNCLPLPGRLSGFVEGVKDAGEV